MKLIKFETTDNRDALEVLDTLRAAVESGEVIAFACVGIEPDDCTRMWSSATKKVTRLRMMGAIHNLLHYYTMGADVE